MPGRIELPNEFGAELNVTRTSAAENGIGSPKVGSECGEPWIGPGQVIVNARKVGVVQDVEKLGAKLKRQVFTQSCVLAHGEVPVGEIRPTKNIATGVAKSSISGRRQCGGSGNVTPKRCELIDGRLIAASSGYALLITADHVAAAVRDEGARIDEWDGSGF